MGKRAVIYVRTSSEQQGEKCSPTEQEADCRLFAEKQGLIVVNVYRDIQRYHIKNKWVEPSGVRYDRPGLLAMLRDAADDQFDVILAWREDRLYRGMRAMLLTLETIQQHNLTIMLALETFDPTTAPLKAWLAQVELENIKERMTMGVKARLRAGKANSGQDRYGYRRVGERIEVVPEEAKWVQQIFAWYIAGVSIREMRRRLIAGNAPQKDTPAPRRIPWSFHSIKGILHGASDYAMGVKTQRREGESFQMKLTPILDIVTYRKYVELRDSYIFPIQQVPKIDFLIRGLLYCPCGYRMGTRISKASRDQWDGEWEAGKIRGIYTCVCKHEELVSPDCPRNIKNTEADWNVWQQVCNAIYHPDLLLEQSRLLVDELKTDALENGNDKELIEKELDSLILNRQWVITQARKGVISEIEMDRQLTDMSIRAVELKKQLNAIQEAVDAQLLVDWEAKVRQYLADLQEGIQALHHMPNDPDEQRKVIEMKRQIIETLVEKVSVDRDHLLTVTIRLHLLGILEKTTGNGGVSNNGGQWPTDGNGNRFNPSGKVTGFKSRIGHIRVSANWIMQGM
ncbi:MAG: recombinase family protein [Chloroflexi bacterium]|nr:recombinase family protein [Chloroflexota bacterium]